MENPAILPANGDCTSRSRGYHVSLLPPSSCVDQTAMFWGSFMWGSEMCL